VNLDDLFLLLIWLAGWLAVFLVGSLIELALIHITKRGNTL